MVSVDKEAKKSTETTKRGLCQSYDGSVGHPPLLPHDKQISLLREAVTTTATAFRVNKRQYMVRGHAHLQILLK